MDEEQYKLVCDFLGKRELRGDWKGWVLWRLSSSGSWYLQDTVPLEQLMALTTTVVLLLVSGNWKSVC